MVLDLELLQATQLLLVLSGHSTASLTLMRIGCIRNAALSKHRIYANTVTDMKIGRQQNITMRNTVNPEDGASGLRSRPSGQNVGINLLMGNTTIPRWNLMRMWGRSRLMTPTIQIWHPRKQLTIQNWRISRTCDITMDIVIAGSCSNTLMDSVNCKDYLKFKRKTFFMIFLLHPVWESMLKPVFWELFVIVSVYFCLEDILWYTILWD